MGHEWILDVITDLQRYAQTHHLSDLEAQLENAAASARVEMNRVIESAILSTQGGKTGTEQLSANVGTSGSA
ncbi:MULTISPECIES: hypothetical protein [Rhodobacterales]|uniref:hypothetical protein n=1 Tax=Rhodobacterales TaxID=204455 RepID=UPI0015EFE700|nr:MULTISPECIES: hypothetical protein [Rhodobacterales]MDO6588700.1 hypothetical protein [Yoonia sp. 1_MG-2023]